VAGDVAPQAKLHHRPANGGEQDRRVLSGFFCYRIAISDVDGVGEFTPGVELINAVGGAINITAQQGLILNDAHSYDALQGLTLASTAGSLFVRETGSSLISAGPLNLSAAGDLTVTGHLVTPKQLSLTCDWALGTFQQKVLLEIGSIAVEAGSSTTLSGHVSGLTGIDIVADGNVNLIDDIVDLAPDGSLPEAGRDSTFT
jgi:hypothetical protein